MKAEYDGDGLPKCPECGVGLSYESAGGRDTETMAGDSIEYLVCDAGCGHFELIDDELFGSV